MSILLLGLVVTLFGLGSNQLQRRNAWRQAQVEAIMNWVSNYVTYNKNLMPQGILPELQQIGTAAQGCNLNTIHCQVSSPECLNLHPLTYNTNVTLPADILIGTRNRTQFAIRLEEDQETITVISCGTEGPDTIKLSKTFSNLRLKPEPYELEATSAASAAAQPQ